MNILYIQFIIVVIQGDERRWKLRIRGHMYICTQKQVHNTTYMYVYKHFRLNAILVNIVNRKKLH